MPGAVTVLLVAVLAGFSVQDVCRGLECRSLRVKVTKTGKWSEGWSSFGMTCCKQSPRGRQLLHKKARGPPFSFYSSHFSSPSGGPEAPQSTVLRRAPPSARREAPGAPSSELNWSLLERLLGPGPCSPGRISLPSSQARIRIRSELRVVLRSSGTPSRLPRFHSSRPSAWRSSPAHAGSRVAQALRSLCPSLCKVLQELCFEVLQGPPLEDLQHLKPTTQKTLSANSWEKRGRAEYSLAEEQGSPRPAKTSSEKSGGAPRRRGGGSSTAELRARPSAGLFC